MIRAVLLAAVCVLPGCGGGCNVPTPQSETCDDVPNTQPSVSRIDIGYITFGRFELIEPESEVPLVVGGQGSDMVVAALRITGSNLGACIAQRTEITVEGEPMVAESAPMRATQLSPAVWQTGDILLPWYGPTGVHALITATVAGESTSIPIWVGYTDPNILDAPVPDAVTLDAWVQDDAPNDAQIPIDAVVDAP